MAKPSSSTDFKVMKNSLTKRTLDLPRILALYREEAVARVHICPILPQRLPRLAHLVRDGEDLFSTNMDNVFEYYEAAIQTLHETGYSKEAKEIGSRQGYLKTLFEGLNVYMIMILRLMEEHLDSVDEDTRDFVTFDYSSLEATIIPHLGQCAPWEQTRAEVESMSAAAEMKILMAIALPTDLTVKPKSRPTKNCEEASKKAVKTVPAANAAKQYLEANDNRNNQDDANASVASLSESFARLFVNNHGSDNTNDEIPKPSRTGSLSSIESYIADLPALSPGRSVKTDSKYAYGPMQPRRKRTFDDFDVDSSEEEFCNYRDQHEEMTDDEFEAADASSHDDGDEGSEDDSGDEITDDEGETIIITEEPKNEAEEVIFPVSKTTNINEQVSEISFETFLGTASVSHEESGSSSESEQGQVKPEPTMLEDKEDKEDIGSGSLDDQVSEVSINKSLETALLLVPANTDEQVTAVSSNRPVETSLLLDNDSSSSSEAQQGRTTWANNLLDDEGDEKALKFEALIRWVDGTNASLSEHEQVVDLSEDLTKEPINRDDEGLWSVPSMLGAAVIVGIPMSLMYPTASFVTLFGIIQAARHLR